MVPLSDGIYNLMESADQIVNMLKENDPFEPPGRWFI